MKSADLIYQFVAFSNYGEVSATSENMKFFLDNFGDKFIPNVRQKSPKDNPGKVEDRLYLTSSDKTWNINLDFEKIDIGLVNLDFENNSLISKSEFLEECINIISILSGKFPRKFKRLAFKSERLLTEIESKDLYSRFTNPLNCFSDTQPLLWENRSTFRKKFESLSNEVCNINYLNGWRTGELVIVGESKHFDGFVSSIDINTSAEIQESRFEIEDIKAFSKEALATNEKVQEEIIQMISK